MKTSITFETDTHEYHAEIYLFQGDECFESYDVVEFYRIDKDLNDENLNAKNYIEEIEFEIEKEIGYVPSKLITADYGGYSNYSDAVAAHYYY